MKIVALSLSFALQVLAFASHAEEGSQSFTKIQSEPSVQSQGQAQQQSASHRILFLGGANLISHTNQPKFDVFLNTVGFAMANDLRDRLRAQKLYVASYIPPQRLPSGDFHRNIGILIARCACTMVVQFTLRVGDGSLRFKFQAMELEKEADGSGVTPQTRWEVERSYFPSQESLESAVPFDITREVVEDLMSRQIFARK